VLVETTVTDAPWEHMIVAPIWRRLLAIR